MSAVEAAARQAELTVVTSDRVSRGATIRRRRMAHGVRSVREFSEKTGLSRDAITGAEKGLSSTSEVTFERLEAWLDDFDHRTSLDTSRSGDLDGEVSAETTTDLSMAPDVVEVEVEGPSTKWLVRFRGHADEADNLRRQAEKLLRNVEDLD